MTALESLNERLVAELEELVRLQKEYIAFLERTIGAEK